MRFKVVIGWRCEFLFDDPEEAMDFAQKAAFYREPSDDSDVIKIEIITVDPEIDKIIEEVCDD